MFLFFCRYSKKCMWCRLVVALLRQASWRQCELEKCLKLWPKLIWQRLERRN